MKKPSIKTRQNLEGAFAGESMAYQKYKYFAKIARMNGDDEIAELFEKTAEHETKHAEGHLRYLFPLKEMTTKKCLEVARDGERYEYTEMYPGYAKTAEEENASDEIKKEFYEGIKECQDHEKSFINNLVKLSKVFDGLSKVEKEHFNNYENAIERFESNEVNKKQTKVLNNTFSESNEFLAENE